MNPLHAIARRLVRAANSYRYQSDYRDELRQIERVEAAYKARTGMSNSDRYLWRSVCQYRSQAYARPRAIGLAANLIGLLALPTLLCLVRLRRVQQRIPCIYLKTDFHPAYQIPDAIRPVTVEAQRCERYLWLTDYLAAIWLFMRCGALYPELLAKYLLWIASIRPILDRFQARYLLQYCEYSPHSSLRKAFLNANGVSLANVAHGEEIISTRSAFSSFDQYFAWDITPSTIHAAMRIEYAEGFTFNPCAGLPRAPWPAGKPVLGVLWPAIAENELDLLVEQLDKLADACALVVRRHPNPRYANGFEEYRPRLRAEVSDAATENVHSFIDRTWIVVGFMSAVLLQAAFRGREVIYLLDPYLTSLRTYHEYYRHAPAVKPAELARFALARLNGKYH
jgi:hypothetical protein